MSPAVRHNHLSATRCGDEFRRAFQAGPVEGLGDLGGDHGSVLRDHRGSVALRLLTGSFMALSADEREIVADLISSVRTLAAHDADTVTASMLPMEIQMGDRFTDHDFEWEVVTHPAALHGGKSLRARMTWPAHVRVDIRRRPRVTE